MKCLILAGGLGERLWPLSRRNYPKQFIELTRYHSVFQDTIARNMPYCDEFLFVTGSEHRHILENQLKSFQDLAYRSVYEDIPRRTTASVALALMSLWSSEYVLIVPSDIMVDAQNGYAEAIVKGKELADQGKIVVFGIEEESFNNRYGYICEDTLKFIEKPSDESLLTKPYYRNLGMILVRAGDFFNELRKISPATYNACRKAYKQRKDKGGDLVFDEAALSLIDAVSVERMVLENSSELALVKADFGWQELTSLEDLEKFSYKNSGPAVAYNSEGSFVVNKSSNRAVVVSGIKDAVVVNTDDAVFVGSRGKSSTDDLKMFLTNEDSDAKLINKYIDSSSVHYRQWGKYKDLEVSDTHYVRHIYVTPGRTIYEHSHENRTENWIIVKGKAMVSLDGKFNILDGCGNIEVKLGVKHQISNVGTEVLEFIDTAYGEGILINDRQARTVKDLGEIDLGVKPEPILKLRPVFRGYLWGGNRLKTEYGFKSDLDRISEAWVMSAHPDAQSRVVNGRHRGMLLGKYIDTVGKSILGWKCEPLSSFPLLVKLIDANDNLSVQVHPDDDYALKNEASYGKNEMWHVIDSKPGSGLYVGFNRDVSREEVEKAVNDGTITDYLNFVPTKAGDTFFIPAGTVHAIGAGNLICEVQQSSNCTYRLYDYDRVDRYGNKRELHIDKALDVIDYSRYEPQELSTEGNLICRCKYFDVLVYDVDGDLSVPADDSKFDCAVVLKGSGKVMCDGEEMNINAGEAVFLPASKETISFTGSMKILMCHV